MRGLHFGRLAGINDAAPDDAFGKTFRFRSRIDQFRNELIERHVGGERGVKPTGDLLASAIDVTSAAIIVAQHVVPIRHPVLRVIVLESEEIADKFFTLV